MDQYHPPATAGRRETSTRAAKKPRMDESASSTGSLTPQSMPFTPSGGTDFTFTSPSSAASSPLIDARASTAPLASADFDDEEVIAMSKKRGASKKRKAAESEFEDDLDHGMDDEAATPRKKKVATGAKKTPTARKPQATKGTKAATYHKNGQADKPDPMGQPAIFALTRQALCETLPWYKAYQSGPYQSAGIIHGLLCDQETDPSDWLDEKIIITRVGGGRKLDATGRMVQASNQETNSRILAFQKSMNDHLPIGVIVGQGNTNSPSKLPHYYNVFGFFHITDMWCDISKGFSRWMVRLEKINLSGTSWWAPVSQQSDHPTRAANVDNYAVDPCPILRCGQCSHSSKQIYETNWVCLNASCAGYFAFPFPHSNLIHHAYNPAFINERSRYEGKCPGPLAPPLLTKQSLKEMGAMGYEIACRQGVVCAKCGCCTRRLQWAKWVCESHWCDWEYIIEQDPVPITDVIWKSMEDEAIKPLPTEFYKGGIVKEEKTIGGYHVNTYQIPGEDGNMIGFVNHFKPSLNVMSQKNGPNDIFRELQESGLALSRKPVRSKGGSPSEIMTAHWAANWGAPYKYRVTNDEKPFTEAHDAILKTVKRLTWAGEYSLSGKSEIFQPFNQCLSVGYFEDSYMGYHDDGEKMLGPTVASLSLGCPAMMIFRPKAGNDVGEQMATNRRNKPSSLRIKLEHGDMMIMHGRDIQKFYEHMVQPCGLLRFALTCRYIRPETFDVAEDRLYVENAGRIPSNFTYEYDGSVIPVYEDPYAGLTAKEKFTQIFTNMEKAGQISAEELQFFISMIANHAED